MKSFFLYFYLFLISPCLVLSSSSPPYPPQGGTDPFFEDTPGKNLEFFFHSNVLVQPPHPATALSPLEGGRGVILGYEKPPIQNKNCNIFFEKKATPEPSNYTIYIFLGEECIISQQYTLLINRLHKEYTGEQIEFIGLFPNPSSNKEKMAVFQEKYKLGFPLKHDALQKEMARFGVKVTPEVVVFNKKNKTVIYQGRIDNMFFRVGKRRTITTTSELEDVLKAIQKDQKIENKKTDAVGCFITPLDPNLKNIPMCKETVNEGN